MENECLAWFNDHQIFIARSMRKHRPSLHIFNLKIKIEKRAAWLERNPDVASILRSEKEIVGCAFIIPLEEQKIIYTLNAQIKPPTYPHDIAIYEPGKLYYLSIRSVMVLRSVPKLQRKRRAAMLISGIIRERVAQEQKAPLLKKSMLKLIVGE